VKTAIERRICALEKRQDNSGRAVHLIEAVDQADSDRQRAELEAAGKIGPRDGFILVIGRADAVATCLKADQ
jgi:hypothetical protein